MVTTESIREQVGGCVVGLALGDALGAPFEGCALGQDYSAVYRTLRRQPLTYTDDTEMMMHLVASLGLIHAEDGAALRIAVERQAEITHAHPLAKEYRKMGFVG